MQNVCVKSVAPTGDLPRTTFFSLDIKMLLLLATNEYVGKQGIVDCVERSGTFVQAAEEPVVSRDDRDNTAE